MAGYEDVYDAEWLSHDPAFRLISSGKTWDRGAALTSRMQSLKTEMLAEEENFIRLARINRELVGKTEAPESAPRVVLDLDTAEIPVYGQQEQSAYNGHFVSTCFHLLLLFNREGHCVAAKLWPGNVAASRWLRWKPTSCAMCCARPTAGRRECISGWKISRLCCWPAAMPSSPTWRSRPWQLKQCMTTI